MRRGTKIAGVALASAWVLGGCALFAGLEDKELLQDATDAPAGDGGTDALADGYDGASSVPEVVLSALGRPRGIAVDPAAIFFVEENAGLVKRLKKGETTAVVMAKGQLKPVEVVLDSTFVYWRSENRPPVGPDGGFSFDTIARLEKDKDQTADPETLWGEGTDKPSEIRSIALYEPTGRTENLLFLSRQDRVSKKPRGANGQDQTIQDNQSRPTLVAADDEWVYWVTEGDYSIRRQKKSPMGIDGGPPPGAEKIYASSDRVFAIAIAVDDENVFWLDQLGRVMRRGKDPSSPMPVELATSESTAAGGLSLDRDSVYWVNGDRGTVSVVAKTGATPKRVLAERQDQPRGIAVDVFDTPKRVYWTTATAVVRSNVP